MATAERASAGGSGVVRPRRELLREYDDLAVFSPVDSSSDGAVWEVCGGADDLGGVAAIKEEFIDCADNGNGNGNGEDSSSPLPALSSWPMPPTDMAATKPSMRDILREVKVREETLQSAVARLGGGAQGLRVLMDHVNFWASSGGDVTAAIRKGITDLGSAPSPAPRVHPGAGADRGAAYIRALRKSHMLRQRGHPTQPHRGHHSPTATKSHCRPQWRPSAHHHSWVRDLEPELGDANNKGYEFLFQKGLRPSDVSSLGRIVLPKKEAERHLPYLVVREGVMLSLEDYYSGTFWMARYRFWPNNKSRMYLLESIGGFVTYHHLQEGDLLLCYRNRQGGYVIRGQKVPPTVKAPAKGLSPKGTKVREPVEHIPETKSTIDTTAMPSTPQFLEGDQSTTGTPDSNSDLANSSLDSLECTLRDLGGGKGVFDDAACVVQPIGYRYSDWEEDVLKTGGFGPASYKPLALQDSSYDPVVSMLTVNVKQRYTYGEEFLELE